MDFRKTVLTLFIDTHTSVDVDQEQVVNLILSPSFYWVKHLSIPVKSLSEAKKFLPSLFEDTVPKGKYNYYAYKDGDAYLIFAYDDKKILDALLEKGLHAEQINRVYFAQSEFDKLDDALEVDEGFVLDIEDHVVVRLPKGFVDSYKPLELNNHIFSKHPIQLTRYAHIATQKSLKQFALFMGGLIAIYMLDWIVSETKTSEFNDAPLGLYAEHDLPATTVQNEVIFQTLQERYDKQISIRQKTGKILNLELEKNEYIKLYDLQKKKLNIQIKLASPKRASFISNALQNREPEKKQYKNGILKLEFEL